MTCSSRKIRLHRPEQTLIRGAADNIQVSRAAAPDARAHCGEALSLHPGEIAVPDPCVPPDAPADEEPGGIRIG